MVARYDTDGEAKISLDEYTAALPGLGATLTLADLIKLRGGLRGPGALIQNAAGGAMSPPGDHVRQPERIERLRDQGWPRGRPASGGAGE